MGVNQVLAATQVAGSQISGGGYVSIVKLIPALLILLVWARLMTWADKDAPVAHLPRMGINIAMLCGMVLAFALFFLLPYYFIALPAVLVIFGAELGTYLILRHQKVGLSDLKDQFNAWIKGMGGKKKEAVAPPGQVLLMTKGGQAMPIPKADDGDRPGYDAAQIMLTDPLRKGADQIDVDSRGEAGTTVRYWVDGVSYTGQALDRAAGAAGILYMKAIAGLDIEDRRKPQSGAMRITIEGQKHDLNVQTAGSTAGESMRLSLDPKKQHDFQLNQLGFSEKQLATVKESIQEKTGIVLLSAPKGMGLTSLMYGILRGHDAFLEHIQTVEREAPQDLDGITQTKLGTNASAAEEFKAADWVISQEPDVILINKVEDNRTAAELIKFAKTNNKRVYIGFRAGSTFEALDQWRKLVGDDGQAVEVLRMVINGRVLRTLCNACKVEFSPDPAMLRKLGMNPEKVTKLFQARTQPLRDPKGNPVPCTFCNDLHFKGRTGVFEIMTIDDEMREAIAAGRPVEQVFRKQRGRFLQEEALALVEGGQTSVQEVKRVMKPGADTEGSPAPGMAAAPSKPKAAPRPSGTPVRKS